MTVELDRLQAEDFASLRDQVLALRSDRAGIACRVESVRVLAPHGLRPQPPFAVTLRGPSSPSLPQGVYTLQHPVHGPLALFVVPIGPCGDGLGYEITFN